MMKLMSAELNGRNHEGKWEFNHWEYDGYLCPRCRYSNKNGHDENCGRKAYFDVMAERDAASGGRDEEQDLEHSV